MRRLKEGKGKRTEKMREGKKGKRVDKSRNLGNGVGHIGKLTFPG